MIPTSQRSPCVPNLYPIWPTKLNRPVAPLPPAATPGRQAPAGACDTHVHMLAAPQEAPLFDGRTEDTATTYADYLGRYRAHLSAIGITRGVIVQSIFYGTDNSITARAVADMGAGFTGIGLVPDAAPDAALDALVDQNLRGVRLNYVHGGVLTWEGARTMAPRLAERGLHIQMLCHADQHMLDLAPDVAASPVPIVFDHIAWPSTLDAGPDDAGFQTLCRLMADGQAYVKLSGLYRLTDAPYTATDAYVRALVAANPERCLWGSDWPHIMLNGAKMPPANALWDAFHRVVPDQTTRKTILVDNPASLYGF